MSAQVEGVAITLPGNSTDQQQAIALLVLQNAAIVPDGVKALSLPATDTLSDLEGRCWERQTTVFWTVSLPA